MDTTSLPRINDNLPTKRHGGAEEANNYKFLYINNNYGWTTMQWEREALHGLEGGGANGYTDASGIGTRTVGPTSQ